VCVCVCVLVYGSRLQTGSLIANVRVYINICVCMHMYIYMHIYINDLLVCACMFTCKYTDIYIRSHTHTHTHTQAGGLRAGQGPPVKPRTDHPIAQVMCCSCVANKFAHRSPHCPGTLATHQQHSSNTLPRHLSNTLATP
jgi:hypothetical protein